MALLAYTIPLAAETYPARRFCPCCASLELRAFAHGARGGPLAQLVRAADS